MARWRCRGPPACSPKSPNGLDHAHLRGLIHRDLKPSNIIITPNDHAKVLDLGLALSRAKSSRTGPSWAARDNVVGTFDYLAPEQAEDAAKVDSAATFYSLGCTLYFALTAGRLSRRKRRRKKSTGIAMTSRRPSSS